MHVLAFWVFAGYAVTFLVLLVAVWVALRRTTTLAIVHVVVVAAVVVAATWSGGSPWRDLSPDLQALCAEAFIGTLGLITMTLALYRDESAAAAAQAAAAERAATEQADLLAAVFGSISDAVCVFDARGDSLLRNPAADRLLGGGRRNARSDWGGRISFQHPDGTDFPDDEVPIARALRGEAVDGVDLLLRSTAHPGGILLNVSAHPLPRERGAVWSGGVVAAFHDVSEVRAASTRVAAAHELLSNVLAAATGHSIIAADTGGRITVFNEGAERMLGWDAAEVLGGDALLVRDPQEVRALARAHGLAHPRDLFARPASAGASTERSTYVRRDGSTLPVSLTTSPMRAADGALLGWISMATDVSELENSEELFRIALAAGTRRGRHGRGGRGGRGPGAAGQPGAVPLHRPRGGGPARGAVRRPRRRLAPLRRAVRRGPHRRAPRAAGGPRPRHRRRAAGWRWRCRRPWSARAVARRPCCAWSRTSPSAAPPTASCATSRCTTR